MDTRRAELRRRFRRIDRQRCSRALKRLPSGLLPGLPGVKFHWPLIEFSLGGAEFLEAFFKAERGELNPFVLVIEGSIANEEIKKEGYWTGFGNAPGTDQPITFSGWIDRLAPKAWAVLAAGTCATYGGIHAMAGNPTGAMGILDYLGWDWKSSAGVPVVCVPGCPTQPDNLSETILYLLWQAAGRAPMIPLDEAGRPTWLFGNTVHEGCDRAGYYEQGEFATEYDSPNLFGEARLLGPGRQVQRPQARLDGRSRRLPERRRNLHRLHDARLPGQVHALHGRAAGRKDFLDVQHRLRHGHQGDAKLYHCDRRQGTEVAA